MKKCRECGCDLIPDKTWFQYKNVKHYICKKCVKIYNYNYYNTHKEQILKQKKGLWPNIYKKKKDYYIAKCNKRRRNLDSIKLFENPFDKKVVIHWHHYDDEYIVALPKDIHMMHYGSNHRENLKPIVHQIYLGW